MFWEWATCIPNFQILWCPVHFRGCQGFKLPLSKLSMYVALWASSNEHNILYDCATKSILVCKWARTTMKHTMSHPGWHHASPQGDVTCHPGWHLPFWPYWDLPWSTESNLSMDGEHRPTRTVKSLIFAGILFHVFVSLQRSKIHVFGRVVIENPLIYSYPQVLFSQS
jgi:hypothetical protein